MSRWPQTPLGRHASTTSPASLCQKIPPGPTTLLPCYPVYHYRQQEGLIFSERYSRLEQPARGHGPSSHPQIFPVPANLYLKQTRYPLTKDRYNKIGPLGFTLGTCTVARLVESDTWKLVNVCSLSLSLSLSLSPPPNFFVLSSVLIPTWHSLQNNEAGHSTEGVFKVYNETKKADVLDIKITTNCVFVHIYTFLNAFSSQSCNKVVWNRHNHKCTLNGKNSHIV